MLPGAPASQQGRTQRTHENKQAKLLCHSHLAPPEGTGKRMAREPEPLLAVTGTGPAVRRWNGSRSGRARTAGERHPALPQPPPPAARAGPLAPGLASAERPEGKRRPAPHLLAGGGRALLAEAAPVEQVAGLQGERAGALQQGTGALGPHGAAQAVAGDSPRHLRPRAAPCRP